MPAAITGPDAIHELRKLWAWNRGVGMSRNILVNWDEVSMDIERSLAERRRANASSLRKRRKEVRQSPGEE